MEENFLRVRDQSIVNELGQSVFLRGINVGGWLMKEGYILHAPNFAEQKMKKHFIKTLGLDAWQEFDQRFKENFILKEDFAQIKSLVLNCVRVPFHYKLIETSPYNYDSDGVKYLDRVLDWAEEFGLYVILDLHAAPGCQNHDWHSDSLGKADFWTKRSYQKRACQLWAFLAKRYAQRPCLAGYDLLNESVLDDDQKLNAYYHEAIAAIRRWDANHILFIEGNRWATDIHCLDVFDDSNYVLSIHTYEPLDMTFNFVPLMTYPFAEGSGRYDSKNLLFHMKGYFEVAQRHNVPLYVGEFGVNYRNGQAGELEWLEDNLRIFQDNGVHWTYWTYKAVKNFMFPDGLFSYFPNSPWVQRHGPLSGWDTYAQHWSSRKDEMVRSWETSSYECHTPLAEVLKKYAN